MSTDTNQQTPVTETKSAGWSSRLALLADGILALAVGLSVLIVHDVSYLLKRPFWLDEAWVAATVRAPLHLVPSLTSSTPVGWTLLLRAVPLGGQERLRLVPLAFAGLAAVVAYLLGRELRLTRFTTGLLTGAAALLSPAMLIRDDLKQYTAEACACLMVWYLVARVENELRLRRMVTLAVATCVGVVFAASLLFVGVAAMAALAFECLVRRQRRELLRLLAVAAGMCVVLVIEYEVLMRPHLNGSLHQYWNGYYVPSSPGAAVRFIAHKLTLMAPFLGFSSLAVDAVGMLAGIAALVWLRRYALAALLPITLVIQIAGSVAGKYPFGDVRTSTFWLVLGPVLMAIAVATVGHRLASADRRLAVVPVVLAALALAGWVRVSDPYIKSHLIPDENVRSQVSYVTGHFRPGDVIVVSSSSRYGFDYYYSSPPGAYVPITNSPVAWVPTYPGKPWIIMTTDRTPATIGAALANARQQIASEPASHRGRIWIIESHLVPVEATSWKQDLAQGHLTSINVGHDPLWLYTPLSSAGFPPSPSGTSGAAPAP